MIQYNEQHGNNNAAGKYAMLVGEYQRALKLLLSATPTADLNTCIEVIKRSYTLPAGDQVVRQFHDYLIGESDGVVKDLNYVFQLYMAIGEVKQAAETATILAQQEMTNGSYSAGHQILRTMHRELRHRGEAIASELAATLLLLHSYVLCKQKDTTAAARMLLRVSEQIHRFPTNAVQLLMSTVIKCRQAGLKKSCHPYAGGGDAVAVQASARADDCR